jgi:chitosanase
MHESRRDFLRLAARICLVAALGGRGLRALAAGPSGRRPFEFVPPNMLDMPMPHNTAPALNPDLVQRIKSISNVFEVGGTEPDYAYVENLGDGRGYTVSQYGFCTYNNEVAQVIDRYAKLAPVTELKRFLPELPPQSDGRSRLAGFAAVWRKEVQRSGQLGVACDEEADELYFLPAVKAAAGAGVSSPIGQAIFYDTWLQHGGNGDPDSLAAILKRTTAKTGGIGATSETEFLRAFLAIRKEVLRDPSNRETRAAWRASASRVDALLHLLDSNPGLVPPIKVASADVDVVVL